KEGTAKELLDKELVPSEAALRPDVGEKVGDVAWKKVPAQGALLDLNEHFPDLKDKAVFVHCYIHSKTACKVYARFKAENMRFWLNGKEIKNEDPAHGRFDVELEFAQGWNSVLAKIVSHRGPSDAWNLLNDTSFICMALFGCGKDEQYDNEGILW